MHIKGAHNDEGRKHPCQSAGDVIPGNDRALALVLWSTAVIL